MINKQIFITKRVYDHVDLKKAKLTNSLIIQNTSQFWKKHLKKQTNEIYIYDLGFNREGTIFPINNHINKTGVNILREEKKQKINFYDITNIYKHSPEGKIVECFGEHQPIFNTKYIQTYNLCNCAILAYKFGGQKVYAFVIN
tara:strand:- start:11015 stop:11443 length:429 start_codon:yes stop_codon:yes gene_type:complete